MGKKWDGKTIKKAHITQMRNFASKYKCSGTYDDKGNFIPSDYYMKNFVNDFKICEKCKDFKYRHVDFSMHFSSFYLSAPYESITLFAQPIINQINHDIENLYKELKEKFGENGSSIIHFCRQRSWNKRYLEENRWKEDTHLSLALESWIRMMYRIEPDKIQKEEEDE